MKYRRGREQKKDRLCRDFGLDGMADEDREEKNLFVAFMILENENGVREGGRKERMGIGDERNGGVGLCCRIRLYTVRSAS